jgi:hypothetical protein
MAVLYFLLSMIAAMLLFSLRRRHPFLYGILECAVGITGLMLTFYPQISYMPTLETTPLGMALSRWVAIVGGIYLLVRGLDNMERDLPRSWQPHWHALFAKGSE